MGGLWSFLLERFSLIPNSGGHLTRGLGEFVSGRTGKRLQDPCWVERGHGSLEARRVRSASPRGWMRHSPLLLLPKFVSDCLGLGAPLAAVLGPG